MKNFVEQNEEILLLNKMKSGAKREWFFVHIAVLESEKLRCEENSVSERNFLFTCGIVQHFFHFL